MKYTNLKKTLHLFGRDTVEVIKKAGFVPIAIFFYRIEIQHLY